MKYRLLFASTIVFCLFGCGEKPCDEVTLSNCSAEQVEQIKKKRIDEQIKKLKEYKAEDFQ